MAQTSLAYRRFILGSSEPLNLPAPPRVGFERRNSSVLEDVPRPGSGPLPMPQESYDDPEVALPPRRRVLVVDDYAPSADGLSEHLESCGFEARPAYSAEHAIELSEAFDPELVVSDLVMPGASGIQLLEQLRARNPEIEFLML